MKDLYTVIEQRIRDYFTDTESEETDSFLLSQELEFEYSKSIVTFAIAFVGGIVTLRTALDFERPVEEGFLMALVLAGLAAMQALTAQQATIRDLRLKRNPSPFRRTMRSLFAAGMLGAAMGTAIIYFDIDIPL